MLYNYKLLKNISPKITNNKKYNYICPVTSNIERFCTQYLR